MKKIISALSLLLLGFTLTACDDDTTVKPEDDKVEIPGEGTTPDGGDTDEPTTPDTNKVLKYLNDLLIDTPLEAQYDTYQEYVNDGSFGDAAASTYVMNNYVVPVVIESLADGIVSAKIELSQIEEMTGYVMGYVTLYFEIENLNNQLLNGDITNEEFSEKYNELISESTPYVELLKVFETEELTHALLTSFVNLDSKINDSLDTITDEEKDVTDQVAFIKSYLEKPYISLICNLNEEDIKNVVFVSNLTLGNTQDFVIDIETVSAVLIEKYLAEGELTALDVETLLNEILASYNKTYGSITDADITKSFDIINTFAEMIIGEKVDFSVYKPLVNQSLNTIDAVITEVCNEDNASLYLELANYTIGSMKNPELEMDPDLAMDLISLLANVVNVSIDTAEGLDSLTIDAFLGTEGGYEGDDYYPGMIEYLSYCANVIVEFENSTTDATLEEEQAYEAALNDFIMIIGSLLM